MQNSSKEAIYSSILQGIPIPVFYEDVDRVILDCNKEFQDWVERPREEIVGKPIHEILPPYIREKWIASNPKEMASKGIQRFEIEYEKEDGLVFYSVQKNNVQDGEGKIVGLTGTITDLTEYKRAIDKHLKEHQLIRTLIDILPAFIYAKDKDSKFLIANQVIAGYMGAKTPEELLGKSDFDFFPYKYAMKYFCDEQEVMNTGRPKINIEEKTSTTEDGGEMWLNTTKVPLRDHNSEIVGIVGSGIDITQRKILTDQLKELQEIVNNSRSCAFLLKSNENWEVTFCTETVSLFGYEPQDFGKEGHKFLEIVHPEDAHQLREKTLEAFKGEQKTFTQEYRIKHKDGGFIWVEDHKHLRKYDDEEEVYTFQSLITDISIRHQYQEERNQMELQLRQSQKLEAVGQLAAGIAHEINTPIQFISDNLDFLSQSFGEVLDFVSLSVDKYKADSRECPISKDDVDYYVEEIPSAIKQSLEGANRVRNIVKAMKEFSHPGNGKVMLEDINTAIENTVIVAKNEWKYVADVELELAENMPMVPVDIGPFKQTILNLIVNASHTIEDRIAQGDFEKGKITIHTEIKGENAVVSVKDTGMGMPKKVAQRIFDPFFTTKEVGKGTGQGMSMAYDMIVRKLKGNLRFNTQEGVGTTFFIEIPLEKREEED